MPEKVSEEQIAAYVDGSLDPAEAATVAAALAQDEALRAYAEEVRQANRLLREAFEAPMREPVSADLRATILGPTGSPDQGVEQPGEVVNLAEVRKARRPWVGMALAASIALVIGVSVTSVMIPGGPQPADQIAMVGTAPVEGPLHQALEALPSGRISDAGVQPMLTFFDGAERICREFEVIPEGAEELAFGIACRTDQQRWDVEIVVTSPKGEVGPDGFVPASGPGADALEAMLDALGAQPAIAPAEEAGLLDRGWR
ncbi:hypothetical protein [Pelagibius sp.]|uniref:hypothetical protein n=1 Tax=Pelagibius sp. TaxID=1931238 RepID=UPI003B500AEA